MHHPPYQRPYTTNNHGIDYSCLLIPKYNNSREKDIKKLEKNESNDKAHVHIGIDMHE